MVKGLLSESILDLFTNVFAVDVDAIAEIRKKNLEVANYVRVCMVGHGKQCGHHAKLARRSNSCYGARDYDVTRISLVNRSIT